MSQNNANQKLNDLLISKNFDPQALDSQGKPASSPDSADLFSFDYTGETGSDYGTVVVMLDDENNLNVYFGDNVGKSMEPEDKKGWFDFLYQLRMFAKRNLLSFSLQDLNKLKYSMQGQAALSEGLFESWAGTKTQSWNGAETDARLMIKHKRAIGENDARFRYIESLFVETVEGERYKLPFTKLSAGRAMLEHVRQGGKPYDIRGQHISTIVNEMNLLSRFKRANQGKIFEGETQKLVEQATHYYETLQSNLKSIGTRAGYTKYFEAWNPAQLSDEDVIIEDLRHMFIEQNIDSRIEQALPLLAKLQREEAMKEVNIFENWTDLILEGTWAIPDTKEKQAQLVSLLSQELPVGPDATNVTELLYDLLGDDELFDRLEELADQDANADARDIILTRLEQLKSNPAVAQVIGQLKNPKPDSTEPVTEDDDSSPVESAIINRIMHAHPDLLAKFGPEAIMNAARDQAEWVGDVDEIGSSDVSAWVNNIVRELGGEQVNELSPDTLKSYIKKAGSSTDKRSASNLASRAADKMNSPVALDYDDEYGYDDGEADDHKSFMRSKGISRAVDRLEESAMSELSMFFDEWMNSEYRPLSSDHGDSNEIMRKAEEFLYGQVSPEKIESYAEYLTRYYEGDLNENGVVETDAAGALSNETVGGGSWLEGKDSIVDQMTQVQDEIEKITRAGGRVALNDPLSQKLKMLKAKLHRSKGVNENTALTGQYGHSGKMEEVTGVDEDMMARIKFLAGIKETDATTENQENSNLTAMKSVSSIFIR